MDGVLLRIGHVLVHAGKGIIPFSFMSYCFVRWLEHFWGWKTSIAVGAKAVWYCLAGLLTFQGDVFVGTIVGYVCFIEAWDHALSYRRGYLERKRRYTFSSTM